MAFIPTNEVASFWVHFFDGSDPIGLAIHELEPFVKDLEDRGIKFELGGPF